MEDPNAPALSAEEAERVLMIVDRENYKQRLDEAKRKVQGLLFIEKSIAYSFAKAMGPQSIKDWLLDGVSHKAIMVRLGYPLRTPKPRPAAKVTLTDAPEGGLTAAEQVAIGVALDGVEQAVAA